ETSHAALGGVIRLFDATLREDLNCEVVEHQGCAVRPSLTRQLGDRAPKRRLCSGKFAQAVVDQALGDEELTPHTLAFGQFGELNSLVKPPLCFFDATAADQQYRISMRCPTAFHARVRACLEGLFVPLDTFGKTPSAPPEPSQRARQPCCPW